MPIYPVAAIPHDQRAGKPLYPGTSDEPYWRPGPRKIMVDEVEIPYHEALFWSGLATVSYLPATAFPAGRGKETGMPIGLQIVGPEGGDYLTIRLAQLLEEEAGFVCEVPPLAARA